MTSPFGPIAARILAQESGSSASAAQVAAGAVTACERLSQRLAALVGDAGVRSLFARSLTLARREYPWLGAVTAGASDAPWSQLRICIAQQPAETASEASVSLLSTFLGLLEKFIGRGLTARFVHDVWPGLDPAPPGEPT